jgi:glycosyltransferase involved in cell wall biosynthesis
MLFAAPAQEAYRCGIPYVMAVHDLQHRLQPEFPEVSANGEWEAREALFSRAIASATTIVVDSNIGREDVLACYGGLISADRIRVLPYTLPPYLRQPGPSEVEKALRALQISGQYLLFPAQFWPHKNHRRVAEALALLHQQGLTVQVVMTGSAGDQLRSQTRAAVRQILSRAGLDGQVRIVGYVDDDSMAALYAGAAGVILPTFFGPTNIPVIEAWAMHVPVLTSDIRGIREQCGEAALLVDPRSTAAIADGIRRLLNDEPLRARLVAAGQAMLALNDADDFRHTLGSILLEAPARSRSATDRPTLASTSA